MPAKKGVPNWRKGTGKLVNRVCATCKKDFIVHVWRGTGKYCSVPCKQRATGENTGSSWKGGKLQLSCPICGSIFMRDPNAATGIRYCSKRCFGQTMKRNVGEKNPNWRGGRVSYYGPNWKEQRRKARKRDNYICQLCGIAEGKYNQKLDVHHIVPFRNFNYVIKENTNYLSANNLSNLISLCMSCHKRIESNGKIYNHPYSTRS